MCGIKAYRRVVEDDHNGVQSITKTFSGRRPKRDRYWVPVKDYGRYGGLCAVSEHIGIGGRGAAPGAGDQTVGVVDFYQYLERSSGNN